ncbi:phosphodiester glycosidase family protein [Botrimarina mediterranea]|uniref:Phosphodiester glycosidase domain-containing protein n=1 Tax=Botrimarina mediterranea TaxID=2528022 RepID=A0A518K6U7_9BACT|nr:phosphodiester glycosidase family protein [Botrimarina mediterranea]QDV73508.1 hypothetical protein Spa11_17050 [Botrimarina mediterranea]QDV78026.1 hypothetical protein K2D_16310 [Planctomycetes bacterium K2D]
MANGSKCALGLVAAWVVLLVGVVSPTPAAVIPTNLLPYTQVAEPFYGITHYQIFQPYNAPASAPFPREVAIHLVEIDASAPGIEFLGTPGNGATSNEYTRTTTSTFVANNDLAVGINGDFFTTNTGITANVNGLGVSNGDIVSGPGGSGNSLVTFADQSASIITSSTIPAGAWNAVSGNQRLVNNGLNVTPSGSYTTTLNPHTAVGVDAETGNVFFMLVDGRQGDFSGGMRTDEMADLFIDFGVDNAINLDGGGSSTLVFADGIGGASRVVNSPSDNATPQRPGGERLVANHFGVAAIPNPAYVPIPAPARPPVANTDPLLVNLTIFDDFEANEGRFNQAPTFSGSTLGITAASTAERVTGDAQMGDARQKLTLVRDSRTTGARVRHVSGGANPLNNREIEDGELRAMGTEGFVGYFLKTTEPDLMVSLGLDDGFAQGVTGTEIATSLPVIADGEWHLYEWDLSDAAMWNNFAGGNGTINGPGAYIDSIMLFPGASTANTTFDVFIDTVAYNPYGSLALLAIPEPTNATLVASMLLMSLTSRAATRRR